MFIEMVGESGGWCCRMRLRVEMCCNGATSGCNGADEC